MNLLEADFETFGTVELKGSDSVGIYNYCSHDATRVLLLGFKLPNEKERRLWQPHLGPMPADLRAALLDPNVWILAYNSAFERYVFQFKCGITIPASRFIDPQVCSRYLSMPGKLETDCEILGLPSELTKDKRGEELIDLFCKPHVIKKKKDVAERVVVYDWSTHPKEWQEFGNYCLQDLVAEAELLRRQEILGAHPLPPFERRLWEFDQKVNDRGVLVDVGFVTSAYKLAKRSKKESQESQNKITGLENANSTTQLLPWVQERGYPFGTLRKDTIISVLKDPEITLSEECRIVLTKRLEAGSTSYTKLGAILRNVSPDGRLRSQFIYMGASRTGRFSGNKVQLQNFARPSAEFENIETLTQAREMIRAEKYDEIKARFGSVLSTVKNCLRTAFIAAPGNRLHIADLASIETRIIAWLAQSAGLMKVFEQGRDAYLDMAVNLTGLPYERLDADLHSNDSEQKAAAKRHRQDAKPAILGCGFQLGGGDWGVNKYGDKIKTGLWGYAEAMGVKLTRDQAHALVRVFRDSYPEIPKMWYETEAAIADVLRGSTTVRKLGPNGCVVIDKINIAGRDPLLRLRLPSGRYLHYLDAKLESTKMPWEDGEGNDVWRESLVYAGLNQTTKQWTRIPSRGGKIFENLVQAIARDILCLLMLLMEERDVPVVMHAHDEAVCETPNDPFAFGYEDMVEWMSQSVSWAPSLLLGADGFSSPFYHK
jgi:DNA polymerase bacteriophage-type